MKVVIVKEIDEMPTDCDSCPFQDFDRNCGILGEYTMLNEWVEDAPYYDLIGKGDCPLKPFPCKKHMRQMPLDVLEKGKRKRDFIIHKVDVDNSYVEGWNDCIDAIMGETE